MDIHSIHVIGIPAGNRDTVLSARIAHNPYLVSQSNTPVLPFQDISHIERIEASKL